jgi:hypothetical protein
MRRTNRRVPTAEERFTAARTELFTARTQIMEGVIAAHPAAPTCLPLPELQVPDSPEGLGAATAVLYANLFTPEGGKSLAWIQARTRCFHLPEDQVDRVFEVIWTWYGLLGDARRFVEAYAQKDAFIRRQEALAMRLQELRDGAGGL